MMFRGWWFVRGIVLGDSSVQGRDPSFAVAFTKAVQANVDVKRSEQAPVSTTPPPTTIDTKDQVQTTTPPPTPAQIGKAFQEAVDTLSRATFEEKVAVVNALPPAEAKKAMEALLANAKTQKGNAGLIAMMAARAQGFEIRDLTYHPETKTVYFGTKQGVNFEVSLYGARSGDSGKNEYAVTTYDNKGEKLSGPFVAATIPEMFRGGPPDETNGGFGAIGKAVHYLPATIPTQEPEPQPAPPPSSPADQGGTPPAGSETSQPPASEETPPTTDGTPPTNTSPPPPAPQAPPAKPPVVDPRPTAPTGLTSEEEKKIRDGIEKIKGKLKLSDETIEKLVEFLKNQPKEKTQHLIRSTIDSNKLSKYHMFSLSIEKILSKNGLRY
jgi:hypothetical protein